MQNGVDWILLVDDGNGWRLLCPKIRARGVFGRGVGEGLSDREIGWVREFR
jgi:hypothetical protein